MRLPGARSTRCAAAQPRRLAARAPRAASQTSKLVCLPLFLVRIRPRCMHGTHSPVSTSMHARSACGHGLRVLSACGFMAGHGHICTHPTTQHRGDLQTQYPLDVQTGGSVPRLPPTAAFLLYLLFHLYFKLYFANNVIYGVKQ